LAAITRGWRFTSVYRRESVKPARLNILGGFSVCAMCPREDSERCGPRHGHRARPAAK
jgi:hypothetical protein